MPSRFAVIERLRENPRHVWRFRKVYGIDLRHIEEGSPAVDEAYEALADAIAAFERTSVFNRFDSKFDFEAAGITAYNAAEQRGADLFDGKAQCVLCHVTDPVDADAGPALLTDFSYDNLGVPENPFMPLISNDVGLQGNPRLLEARGAPTPLDEVEGRHKVMSLRNIAMTPPYMHNGVFQTLEQVVHFYNTRDVLPECQAPADATNPGFGITCWPKGEFHETRNTSELGDLGLTPQEEADLVEYLKTFTDNYPSWGNKHGLRDPNVPRRTPSPFADFPVPNANAE